MEKNETPTPTPLPGVIKVLGEGCSLAAEKAWLMAIPFAVDLMLLFGPKLRISEYFGPMFESALSQMSPTLTAAAVRQMEAATALIREFLGTVNLFGFIQTFPVGIGILNSSGGSASPLGNTPDIQLNSILLILPIIMLMTALGVLLGTIYYALTAAAVTPLTGEKRMNVFGKQLLNTILMYLALAVVLFALMIPISCGMTFSMLASPLLYQLFSLLMIAAVCWLVIPLFYIPHGIFVKRLDFPQAFKTSLKMGAWSGTLTVRFILLSVVITLGMDMIWTIPEQSSWLILFSIFGHAYVTTALLAGSFILFKELDQWQNENSAFLEWRKANFQASKFFKKDTENND